MTYTAHGDDITLQFTQDEYDGLMLVLGMAAGSLRDPALLRFFIGFVNQMNAGNPDYKPYALPEEPVQ